MLYSSFHITKIKLASFILSLVTLLLSVILSSHMTPWKANIPHYIYLFISLRSSLEHSHKNTAVSPPPESTTTPQDLPLSPHTYSCVPGMTSVPWITWKRRHSSGSYTAMPQSWYTNTLLSCCSPAEEEEKEILGCCHEPKVCSVLILLLTAKQDLLLWHIKAE